MKKILYSLLAGATMLLGSCSKESNTDNLAPIGAETTFTLSVAELQSRVKPTETITPTRYVMEVWSEDGTTAQNVIKKSDGTMVSRLELSSGSFTAQLDKTKAYVCLFWADYSAADDQTGAYNATSLKAVALNSAKVATEAYYAKVDVAKGKNLTVAVMLKRAVAKITLNETTTVEAGKDIVFTYTNNTAFNTLNGTVSTPANDYKSTITTVDDKLTGTLGEFYMLSTADGETVDMSIKYDDGDAKSLTNVPLKQNYNTKLTGQFSNMMSKTFTVTADDTWNSPDNVVDTKWEKTMQFTIDLTDFPEKTYRIATLQGGTNPVDFMVDWGDGSEEVLIPRGISFNSETAYALLNHTYAAQQSYKITITSTVSPDQVQLPRIFFGSYIGGDGYAAKLRSMDSPMLNMGESLGSCFQKCTGLTEIPATLFEKNTAAKSFNGCFTGCTGLTEIPVTLFEKNTAVEDFSGCFTGCTGLTEIPATLFAKNEAVKNFTACFTGCTKLTEIPATLFAKNEAVKNFTACFTGCTGLIEIPAKLFEKNAAAENFTSCFKDCSTLAEIPATLFEKNTAAKNFSYCFNECTGLTEIPAMLFAKNTAAENFEKCFIGCTKAKLNPNIFSNEATESTSRFSGKTMKFNACFFDCGSTLAAGEGGTAPALWSYTVGTGTTFAACFKGATAVTNVSAINSGWK